MKSYVKYLIVALLSMGSFIQSSFASITAVETLDYEQWTNKLELPLQKPRQQGCMEWIKDLEAGRDTVKQAIESKFSDSKSAGVLTQDWESLKKLSEEINQTLGGKYGISDRLATEEEQKLIAASIHKTYQIEGGLNEGIDSYLGYNLDGCWQQLRQADSPFSQHIAGLAAMEAIVWAAYTDRPEYDAHNQDTGRRANQVFMNDLRSQQGKDVMDSGFTAGVIQMVIDLHADGYENTLRGILSKMPNDSWKKVVSSTGTTVLASMGSDKTCLVERYIKQFFPDEDWLDFLKWIFKQQSFKFSSQKQFSFLKRVALGRSAISCQMVLATCYQEGSEEEGINLDKEKATMWIQRATSTAEKILSRDNAVVPDYIFAAQLFVLLSEPSFGESALSLHRGQATEKKEKLLENAKKALEKAISQPVIKLRYLEQIVEIIHQKLKGQYTQSEEKNFATKIYELIKKSPMWGGSTDAMADPIRGVSADTMVHLKNLGVELEGEDELWIYNTLIS